MIADLHVHTEYSLLDGAIRINDLFKAVKEKNMHAIAITDHGNMFSCIELYQAALKKGLKPIFGFEAYITPGKITVRDPKMPLFHLVLLAQNMTGYKNLLKLASIGYTEGFYRKPRIDYECLEQYSEGLIGLGACLKGEIPQALLNDDKAKAVEILKRYQKIFGIENFYVEIQNHGIPEEKKANKGLVELAKKYGYEGDVQEWLDSLSGKSAYERGGLSCGSVQAQREPGLGVRPFRRWIFQDILFRFRFHEFFV